MAQTHRPIIDRAVLIRPGHLTFDILMTNECATEIPSEIQHVEISYALDGTTRSERFAVIRVKVGPRRRWLSLTLVPSRPRNSCVLALFRQKSHRIAMQCITAVEISCRSGTTLPLKKRGTLLFPST